MEKATYEFLAKEIFSAALEVHKSMGPVLLESVYEHCLVRELQSRNINVSYQVKVPLFYKGSETGKNFILDILVENEIIIEVKSCEEGLNPVHRAQLISYLKLANKKLGFLINFNVVLLKEGFKRIVNNY